MKKQFLLSLMAMLLPLTMWAADKEFKASLAKSTITYNGTATAPEITVKDGNTPLVYGTHYFVSYSKKSATGTTALNAVGEYIANVQGVGDYSGFSDTKEFTVTKKPVLSLTLNHFSKEYGTKDAAFDLTKDDIITISPEDIAPGDTRADIIKCLTLKRVETGQTSEDVGPYLVTVEDNEVATNNYSYHPEGSNNVTMTIEPKELEVTWTNQEYTGNVIELTTFNPTLQGALTEDNITVSFEKQDQKAVIKDVADYPVNVKLSGAEDKLKNYTLKNSTETVKVTKATLTITAKVDGIFKKNFGDKDPNLTAQFTIGEWLGNDAHETVTMVRDEGEDAKTYEIKVEIKKGNDVVETLKNYEIK